MEDYLKFIYDNYTSATHFEKYWFTFENYLDHYFPHSGSKDSLRKRADRFEDCLKQIPVHEEFLKRLYGLPEAKRLAELQPMIFRETNQDKSAHRAFASDYSRVACGQKPTEPVARLVNLAYTVRCNSQHGQKIFPDEWEDIRKRNEQVFALITPLISCLAELVITQFIVSGIFSYGTLQEASDADFSFNVEREEGLRIKGRLYDMGRFPAWRYNTWEWVHGCVLSAPESCRLQHVDSCDDVEGDQFERRLVLVYDKDDQPKHLAWAYHYKSEPDLETKIKNGIWGGSRRLDTGFQLDS